MKLIKKTIPAVLALSLLFLFSFNAFADTYYYADGYLYTMPDQNHAVIYGIDDDDYSDISFPELVNNRQVSAVGIYAFSGDENVTSVSCENATHMEKISAYSFENCVNLNSVTLTPTISIIGTGAYEGCTSLTSFDWAGAAVEIIPTQAFYGCSALQTVEIPSGVTEIGPFAFAECTSLGTVTIGNNVTQIAETAFNNDNALTIDCYYGSCAYYFAKEHNIPYELIDGALLGDTTGDGLVNINDVTAIQRHVAELEILEGINLHAGDVNQNDVTDITDASVLQGYLAEYETGYPIGEAVTQ